MTENKYKEQYQDLLHIYLSDVVASFPDSAKHNLYGVTFRAKVYKSLEALFKYSTDFIKWVFNYKQVPADTINGKNWLYIVGTNNYNSVAFLQESVEDCVFVSPYYYKNTKAVIHRLVSPVRIWYLLQSLPLFFLLISDKKNFRYRRCWDALFRSMGAVESALWLLKKYKPASVIFSNDHTLEPRALLLAAKQLNITTFYIQHACVRRDFPPLKFDHNLLEGQFAKDIYSEIAPISGAVHLIGIPRMDAYLPHKNASEKVRRIGICSNLLDEPAQIEDTIWKIYDAFPDLILTYRPHPSDKRLMNIPADRLQVSDSNKESAFQFLQNQDVIIAGDTSIHYEAVMLNVNSIYFRYGDESRAGDLYLFCKNGIATEAHSIADVIAIIRPLTVKKTEVYQKACYYNAALGTAMEGESWLEAGGYIKNIISRSV
jgi:hypothetical protein